MTTPTGTAPKAVALRQRVPTKPGSSDLLDGSYAPGRIRDETDQEQTAIERFTHEHPEYSGLPPVVIQQHMSMQTRRAAQVAEVMQAEGIPEDWQERRSDDAGPRLSEEV